MKYWILAVVSILALSCGGGEEPIKESGINKGLPEILGGTDSFLVRTKEKEAVMLAGEKVRTTYATFNTDRAGQFGFLGSVMRRLNENGSTLLGPVHLVMLEEPKDDTMEYFIGLPVSSSKGFVPNELYQIPKAIYYTAMTGKAAGLAMPMHKVLQSFLKENEYGFGAPIIEVWKEQMEKDMTKHENIQLLYKVK